MNEGNGIRIDEVEEVPRPPRARVDLQPPPAPKTDIRRKVDYLEGFLSQKPAEIQPGEIGGELYEAVIEALKSIYDPEIPVNIYDLGLIYGVRIAPDNHAVVDMTLTTPNCPVAESMPQEVEIRVGAVPGVGIADVNLVWDPPWDPSRMTEDARLALNMF